MSDELVIICICMCCDTQRQLVTGGVLRHSVIVVFDKYEFTTSHLSPYSHDFARYHFFICFISASLRTHFFSKIRLMCFIGFGVLAMSKLSLVPLFNSLISRLLLGAMQLV